MPSNFRLITNATKCHSHKLTVGRLGNRFTQRGLTHTRRAYKAKNGALKLAYSLLHREVLEDAVLNLFKSVVILIKNRLSSLDIVLYLAAFCPGEAHQPIDVAANN